MAQLFRNNAFSALAASLTNVATTLTVTTGHGDRFPAATAPDFFLLTLQDASNNIEIVRVTARTVGADSMTIQRAQEGTSARAWNIGDVVELRLTAFALNPLSLLEGSATAAAVRAILDVPTRAGGDASGTWNISISGNAATATSATTAAACSGNAATATTLQTARAINGTSFNGSADITTANWGTARTLTIGSTGKSVNGSGNVSWSLAEIGAFPAGGGSMAGALAVGGSNAPAVTLDVQTSSANAVTSLFTTGLTDLNFRIGAMCGVAGGTAGTTQGKLGLFYMGTGEVATIDFLRGATATDGSFAFRTNGTNRATLDNSGNLSVTGSVTATAFIGDGSQLTGVSAVPAGAVIYVAMNSAPTGYLKANGAAVSRTTYAALFAAIGTTYGAGDGSTTFNLPDLRAEFIRGWDDGRGVDTGRAIGSAQAHQMQSHTHTIQTNSGEGGFVRVVSSIGAGGTTQSTDATGGTSNSSENRPRNVALLACIKF